MKKCSFLLLILAITLFAGGRVPDTTSSSASVGDILPSIEDFDRLVSAISATIAVSGYIREQGGFSGIKENLSEQEIKEIKEGLKVKYKNSKAGQGFFNFIRATQGFLLDILNTAGDRIDMWRTTLPALQAWGRSTKRLADNTRQVYRNFQWNALWDIDRKWSRQMERVNVGWINHTYRFMDYLSEHGRVDVRNRFVRYQHYLHQWRADSTRMAARERADIARIQEVINSQEFQAMEELTNEGRVFLFRRLPLEMQETAIQSLVHTYEILADGATRGNGSKEDKIEYFQDNVSNPNITYLGSMALLASIKQERAALEAQRVMLRQMQSSMSAIYARVQMMPMEEEAVRLARNTHELRRITGGFVPREPENEEES